MANWEYKILEFTGNFSTLQGFLVQESEEKWELGALLPVQMLSNNDQSVRTALSSASQGIYVIFKRQISAREAATTTLAQ